MEDVTKHVAAYLRGARLAKGLTQEELAARLGLATESISHIERGVTVPALKTIAAAAKALDESLADLFAGYDGRRAKTTRRAENEAVLRRLSRDLDDKRLALVIELAEAVARFR